MCDEWMPQVRLALTPDEFRRLPRNGAYQYDYPGSAVLTPRPRYYHALLPLPPRPAADPPDLSPGVALQLVRDEDISALEKAFVAAFLHVQPFAALAEDELGEAAGACLQRTAKGGDGPWLREASFAALRGQEAVGAVLVTLLPDGDPCAPESYYWPGPAPEDFALRRLGRPHLTWIFVSPTSAGHGVGTALLGAATSKLVELGYTQLLSTFLVGNDASLLWHWRSGFQLLSYPASTRRLARRLRGQ